MSTVSLHIQRAKGFTIIEVLVSIVIIGIIAAVALSRMLRSDTYDAIIARDQIISLSRAAQQKALGRNDIELSITPSGNNLNIAIEDSTGPVQSAQFGSRNVSFSGDVNELDGCGVTPGTDTVSGAAPFVLKFDSLGDLMEGGVTGSTGFPVAVSSGARLCINNDAAMSVCWSAAGYAYVGDCVE